jgi:hypothetical protein
MLYKYCDIKGFNILLKHRLRLSKFDDFNDPFELLFGIDVDSGLSNIEREYKQKSTIVSDWRQILDNQRIEYDKNSDNDVLDKFTKLKISDFNKIPDLLRKHWNETKGIVCLSESMDIIQMWAHYTENHTGIVVGIEESEFVEDKENIVTVCYRDKMVLLPITSYKEDFEQNMYKYLREVLSRKETKWSYEKEIRLYGNLEEKDSDGHYYIGIPPSSIKEIYLGLRSSEDTRLLAKCIKQKDKYNHLKIYEMVRHESAYKLLPREI